MMFAAQLRLIISHTLKPVEVYNEKVTTHLSSTLVVVVAIDYLVEYPFSNRKVKKRISRFSRQNTRNFEIETLLIMALKQCQHSVLPRGTCGTMERLAFLKELLLMDDHRKSLDTF